MRRALVLLILCLLMAAPGRAAALPGSYDDPEDTQGPLDVKQVRHSDTETAITYEMETYDSFEPSDVDDVTWGLDYDGDREIDACISAFFDGESGYDSDVFGNGCSADSTGKATVTQPEANVLRVVVPVSLLRQTGLTGVSYGYDVEASHVSGSQLQVDSVPDDLNAGITHELGEPATASPTVSPLDTQPPPTKTPQATETPTVTPTPPGTPAPQPTRSSGTVDRATVLAGQTVSVAGNGFAANTTLAGLFRSEPIPLAATSSDSSGSFRVSVTIPSQATAGPHTIEYSGRGAQGATHTVVASVTVTAPGVAADASDPLPSAGSTAGRDARRALALLTLGTLLIGVEIVVRRSGRAAVWESR